MKTILVPIDFSEASENAMNYAAEIAEKAKAKLILLHVYTMPAILNDSILSLPPFEGVQEDYQALLQQKSHRISSKMGYDLDVDCIYREGDVIDEISLVAEEHAADLIVMGIRQTDFLTEKVIGSVTASLLTNASCPVLAIPKELKFKSIKSIVLASDFQKTDSELLQPLKEFAHLFHSELYILNVIQTMLNVSDADEVLNARDIHQHLAGVKHFFHDIHSDDIVDGINKFIQVNEMDLVAMIPREHSRFVNFFREPRTKKLAFHASVPLLALHTKSQNKMNAAIKKLVVKAETSVRMIQEQFNGIFPYLKLEFYSKTHAPGKPSNIKFIQQPEKLLASISKEPLNGNILLVPEMTVSDLEQQFAEEYGLGVQVFRRSGSVWLETTITDNWTLQKQNREGEFLSEPILPDEPTDYAEQD